MFNLDPAIHKRFQRSDPISHNQKQPLCNPNHVPDHFPIARWVISQSNFKPFDPKWNREEKKAILFKGAQTQFPLVIWPPVIQIIDTSSAITSLPSVLQAALGNLPSGPLHEFLVTIRINPSPALYFYIYPWQRALIVCHLFVIRRWLGGRWNVVIILEGFFFCVLSIVKGFSF